MNLRALTASLLSEILYKGRSLNTLLLRASVIELPESDKKLIQMLCFGTLRTLTRLEWYLQQLVAVSLRKKQPKLHCLLLVGCYQLLYTRIPSYAAINETVDGAVSLGRSRFKGLINGVLRQFLRQKDQIMHLKDIPACCHFMHPDWLLQKLQQAYPEQWQQIIDVNNQHPLMWLRVNRQRYSRTAYLKYLVEDGLEARVHPSMPYAIYLVTPVPVARLPGFFDGAVSVQDSRAQQGVELLEPQAGELILDLCAAPGGKTTQILEYAPEARVIAVDNDAERLLRVSENLQRLKQRAQIICGDAKNPKEWCQGMLFDRILLDAPCSATGVIRRHPDIKWLRRANDSYFLAQQQKEILQAIWSYLKPGGVLIYTTCSILHEENRDQIRNFLKTKKDVLVVTTGDNMNPGWQYLPDTLDGDGFFYAKLVKR